ncbi:efflux RND transporter periplasmic adaptor subunit [Thiofaba sp. EF100]|uniref:efflux RND transporter periplasmic adaptor subunit n=1 Tax=Thiofaba sp. EF100 TaxID=3121274 RepID=UPI0032221FE3
MNTVRPLLMSLMLLLPLSAALAAPQGGGMPPAPVKVIEVKKSALVETAVYPARLRAVEQVEVRPRVGGMIERVLFKDGARVEKGQVLYEIDPRPYAAQVARAEAALAQAEAQLNLARAEAARGRSLAASQALAREAIEQRDAASLVAEANVRAARAALEAARLDLDFTRVRAPIAGRINRTLITAGNLVSGPGGNGATLLTTLVPLDPLHVYFELDERTMLGFGDAAPLGAMVGVALEGEEDFPHKARIDYLDHSYDPSSGTRQVRAVLDNPKGIFAPGQFVRVLLTTARRYDTVSVPSRAVGADQGRRFVLVVGADDTVEYRPVTLGPEIGGRRPVLSGLAVGERVIVDGMQKARPGSKVAPQPLEEAPSAAECGPSNGISSPGVAPKTMDDCLSSGRR